MASSPGLVGKPAEWGRFYNSDGEPRNGHDEQLLFPTARDVKLKPMSKSLELAHPLGEPRRIGRMSSRARRHGKQVSISVLVGCALLLLGVASAGAETLTFGSPLTASATLNTASGLGYPRDPIQISGTSEFLIAYHDGADTLLWNAVQASGSPTAPTSGQVTSVTLKGCAEQPPGAPAPLTDIHFQDLVPQAGGNFKINVTTQTFTIPVCGKNGADGNTLTSYQPTNFCVSQGDWVGFNDEGGFVPSSGPPPYPSGVPYMVIGAVPGSTLDSFIRNGGTNNGTVISPSDQTGNDGFDGFRSVSEEELLLQSTLATGPDASPLCGGTKGVPAPSAPRSTPLAKGPLVTATLPSQSDGMNKHGVVEVAVFCHAASPCNGTLTLLSKPSRRSLRASKTPLGHASFTVSAHHTGKVKIHLNSLGQRLVRSGRGKGVSVKASLSTNPLSAPIDGNATRFIALRGARPSHR